MRGLEWIRVPSCLFVVPSALTHAFTPAFVYIVLCRDGTPYIGTARDLAQHYAGKGAKYTRSRGPVRLVWQEGPMIVSRALRREHQLKQLTRPQKFCPDCGPTRAQAPAPPDMNRL